MLGEIYLITVGLTRRLYVSFFIFYIYLTVVFVRDAWGFLVIYHGFMARPLYNYYYKIELVVYILLFGIVFDLYHQVFKPFPAIHKFFRGLLLLFFVGPLILAATKFPLGSQWWTMTMMEFGKNIRFAVALLLMLILSIVGYYKVPLNRNLKGLLFGLAFYNIVAVAISALFASQGPQLTALWQMISVLTYMGAILIWIFSLSTVAAPISAVSSSSEATGYAVLMPEVIDGLCRINSRLSLWLEK